MSDRRYLYLGLVLLGLALGWVLLHRPQASESFVSGAAPGFALRTLVGTGSVTLNNTQGKVRLIAFWATWCPPCVAEIPTLKKMQETYGPKGFQVIAISLDENVQAVLDMNNEIHFNYPVLEGNQQVVKDYGDFTGVPTSFLVGKDGMLREVIPGMAEESSLKTSIEDALKGK